MCVLGALPCLGELREDLATVGLLGWDPELSKEEGSWTQALITLCLLVPMGVHTTQLGLLCDFPSGVLKLLAQTLPFSLVLPGAYHRNLRHCVMNMLPNTPLSTLLAPSRTHGEGEGEGGRGERERELRSLRELRTGFLPPRCTLPLIDPAPPTTEQGERGGLDPSYQALKACSQLPRSVAAYIPF